MTGTPVLDFWFDFASTYSYPAAMTIEDRAAKAGVAVRWRPILLGAIFGVVDETLTIASTLSHRSPFMAPFDKREQADEAKRSFATGQSDHLAVLNAYMAFDRMGSAKYEFARENFLGIKTMQMIGGLSKLSFALMTSTNSLPTLQATLWHHP